MQSYTKEFKEAFGYKSIIETIFESPKTIIVTFTDETQKTFKNVYKIDYLENRSFVSVVINYDNTSFETSSINIEKMLIAEN